MFEQAFRNIDDVLRKETGCTTRDLETPQTCTFYSKEKKSLAYVIALMNMILHGSEAPNIIHTNTLTENLADSQDKDRYDVVLTNPPFGGKERKEVQQNFPIRTGKTVFLSPKEIMDEIVALDAESAKVPGNIRGWNKSHETHVTHQTYE